MRKAAPRDRNRKNLQYINKETFIGCYAGDKMSFKSKPPLHFFLPASYRNMAETINGPDNTPHIIAKNRARLQRKNTKMVSVMPLDFFLWLVWVCWPGATGNPQSIEPSFQNTQFIKPPFPNPHTENHNYAKRLLLAPSGPPLHGGVNITNKPHGNTPPWKNNRIPNLRKIENQNT